MHTYRMLYFAVQYGAGDAVLGAYITQAVDMYSVYLASGYFPLPTWMGITSLSCDTRCIAYYFVGICIASLRTEL